VLFQTNFSSTEGIKSITLWNQYIDKVSESNEFIHSIIPSAFDRYCYVYNNPLSFSDPTGHSAIPEDSWMWRALEWTNENLKMICNNPPSFIRDNWFVESGRRIIVIDYPHRGGPWHINTDLKALQSINHKDIEPIILKIIPVVEAIKNSFYNFPGEFFIPIIPYTPDMWPPSFIPLPIQTQSVLQQIM